MANFIATLSKLTGLADYFFWRIYVKLALALITYSEAIFTTEDMLSALAFSQTTNMDKITRKNFLSSQALDVLNSTLLDNLSMHNQPNAEALWAYL